MTAFGPYKDTEVIDFSELANHHLFVIAGATGAGKTTIFDGICFSLYGSASGTDRESTAMLRSHFADDDVHTAVELLFELKGKTYRVLRQLGHTKKGNKTRTGEKYEFYEVIGEEEVPRVDRQMVSEINEKIEQLIGLTQDQFKQIVMLPQGEFRKLLTSETENKEDILRRLFKTEKYQHMNHLLKERRDEVEQQFKQEKQLLDHYVQNISTSLERREEAEVFALLDREHYQVQQIIPALTLEKEFYQTKMTTDQQHMQATAATLDKQQQAFYQAKITNERLAQLEEKKTQRKALEKEQTMIKQKEAEVEAAERASHIVPYEAQWKAEKNEVESMINKEQQVSKQFQQATTERDNVLQQYEIEEKKAQEREQLKQEITRLREFLPKVQEIDGTKQKVKKLHTEMKTEQAALEEVQATGQQVTEEVEALKKVTEDESTVQEQLQTKKSAIDVLVRQHEMVKSFLDVQQKQQAESTLVEKTEKAYKEQKHTYDKLEKSWLENQAVMLATQLHEGSPCPVCGSEEHPAKATTNEQVVTRETLDQEKITTDKCHQTYMNHLATYQTYEAQWKEKQAKLKEENLFQENMAAQLAKITENGKELRQQISTLETSLDQMKEQKKRQAELEQKIHKLLEKKEAMDKALREKHTTYTTLKATFAERIREIPEEMQVLEKLQQTLTTTENQANKLEQDWLQIQASLRKAESTFTTEKANVENTQAQMKQAQTKLQQVEQVFQEKIVANKFTDEKAYQMAKLSETEQTALRQEITTFKETVLTIDKQIIDWTEELAGKQTIDLNVMEAEVEACKKQYEDAMKQYNQAEKQLELVNDFIEKIHSLEKKTANLEKKFAMIADLYDVLRGQNSRKISFERYVQIDYLDQITAAANERFRELSNGQYHLIRSDRQEAYGKQSGLAIDVHDAYTGQTRDVKTLSGGEKFIASLCLALGMSDVIQSFQGSISIDTMFIDEGFGSLDEESLYKAIDALINIQKSGRMIGVISHVEELKSIFPATLSVEKTKEGFSKTEFVLK